jgi:hypothetical protein
LTRLSDTTLSHANTSGDLSEEQALSTQEHDVPKALLALGSMDLIFAFHLLLPGLGMREGARWCSKALWHPLVLRLAKFAPATGQQLFQSTGQIAQKVEPVSDLPSLGSGFSRGGSVIGSAIAANNAHLGMRTQPPGEGVFGTIWQQINNCVPLEVDEDRAVAPPFLPAPITHTQHPDGLSRGRSQLHELAQQGGRRGGDSASLGEPRALLSPCDQPKDLHQREQPRRHAPIRLHQSRQTLAT